MRRRCVGVVLLLIGLARSAAPQEDDPQAQALWSRWLDEPLVLREASAGEIALLPWVDHEQAALIEGLAREGSLEDLDDLRQVPGLDEDSIAALAPFVELGGAEEERGSRWRARWKQDELYESGRAPGYRRTLSLEQRHLRASLRARPGRTPRGWAVLRGEGWRIGAGSLRARPPSALLRADPTARSRTAAVSSRLDPGAPWRGSSSTGLSPRVLAAELDRGIAAGSVFVERTADGRTSGWTELRAVGDSLAGGIAVASSEALDGAAWLRRRGPRSMLRAEIAGDGRVWRSSAAWIWTPPRWRVGLATTHAFASAGGGSDPITQLALDREHRGWQLSARRRWPRVTATLLLRQHHRGGVGQRLFQRRTRLWIRYSPRGGRPGSESSRWQLRLRLGRDSEREEREVDPTVELDARLDLRRRQGDLRQRLVLSRRGRPGAASRALSVQIDGGRRPTWRVVHAMAAGERSHPWAAGLHHGGVLLRWLAPGESLVLLSLGSPHGGLRWGAWVAAAWSREGAMAWEGGWSLRWETGADPPRGSGAKVAAPRARGASRSSPRDARPFHRMPRQPSGAP